MAGLFKTVEAAVFIRSLRSFRRVPPAPVDHDAFGEDPPVGGDEFACLVTGLSSRDRLQRLAHNLLESVAAPIAVGSLRLSITPSIGIAIYPTDGRETDALLKSADTAMYRAKRQRIGYTFV